MQRNLMIDAINYAFTTHSVVVVYGPRKSGKSELAYQYACSKKSGSVHYFDLESCADLGKFFNPMLVLENLTGTIIIDQAQKAPQLIVILKVLIAAKKSQQFLLLGNFAQDLIASLKKLQENLTFIELTPFRFSETNDLLQLWERGGLPPSYLANSNELSFAWRENYINNLISHLSVNLTPQILRQFWAMLAHYHGNVLNASNISRSLNIAHTTIHNYLPLFTNTFLLRELKPIVVDIKKRQVKASKIYLRDSGILHTLLRINSLQDLYNHPKLAHSWEGLALEEIISVHHADTRECFFWSTYTGAKLDLLLIKDGKKHAFEFQYTKKPKITKSMRIACDNLKLDGISIIYCGVDDIMLSDNIRAVGLEKYLRENEQNYNHASL